MFDGLGRAGCAPRTGTLGERNTTPSPVAGEGRGEGVALVAYEGWSNAWRILQCRSCRRWRSSHYDESEHTLDNPALAQSLALLFGKAEAGEDVFGVLAQLRSALSDTAGGA